MAINGFGDFSYYFAIGILYSFDRLNPLLRFVFIMDINQFLQFIL